MKLFKNLSGYKGKKKFKAYLYTIANHLCIDESRKVEFYPLEDEENIVHEYNDIVRLEDRAEISYFWIFYHQNKGKQSFYALENNLVLERLQK